VVVEVTEEASIEDVVELTREAEPDPALSAEDLSGGGEQ